MRAPNRANELSFFAPFEGYCPDYSEIAEMYLAREYSDANSGFRGVFPSWDNTARRGVRGTVILNGTPENYEFWLSEAIRKTVENYPNRERLLFVNAWNEWAEGCHLEPDRRYGHRFLEATLRAKQGSSVTDWTHRGIPPESVINGATIQYFRPKRKNPVSRAIKHIKNRLKSTKRQANE